MPLNAPSRPVDSASFVCSTTALSNRPGLFFIEGTALITSHSSASLSRLEGWNLKVWYTSNLWKGNECREAACADVGCVVKRFRYSLRDAENPGARCCVSIVEINC